MPKPNEDVDLEYALGTLPSSSHIRPAVHDLHAHDRARVRPVLAAIAAEPALLVQQLRMMYLDALDVDDATTRELGLWGLVSLRSDGHDVDVASPIALELFAEHPRPARELLMRSCDVPTAKRVLSSITNELATEDPFDASRGAHLMAWCAWVIEDAAELERFASDPWFAIRDGTVGALVYAVTQDVRRDDALVRLVAFLRDPAGCVQTAVVQALRDAVERRLNLSSVIDQLRAAQDLGAYDTEHWLHGPLDDVARSDLQGETIGGDVRALLDAYFLATVE